jgi:hypothetical protein
VLLPRWRKVLQMSTPETPASKLPKGFLWPLIAPAVLLVTHVGFYSYFLFCDTNSVKSCSPVSSETIVAVIKSLPAPDVAIYVARASWTLANGLYLLACIAALVAACFVMKEVLSNFDTRWPRLRIFIIILLAANVALLMSAWASHDTLSPAQQLLRATVGQAEPEIHINRLNRLFDAISLTATLSLAFAASAILFQRDSNPQGKEELRRRQTLLRYVLYFGAALLAIAVLALSARLGWGTSYLPAESPLTTSVNSLVTGIVNSMGAFYALLMAAVYIPAALVLQSRVKQLAAIEAPDDPNTWLTNNGFSLSVSDYVRRIVALLGPMLAGPLGVLLTQASSAISG